VLELMELSFQPLGQFRRLFPLLGLADLGDTLGSVWKVQKSKSSLILPSYALFDPIVLLCGT